MKRDVGIVAFVALAAAVAIWNAPPAGADEMVVAQASPSPAASPAPSPSPSPTPAPIPHAFSFAGFVDTGYTSASNASAANTYTGPPQNASSGNLISGRVFDYDNHAFDVHDFNLQVAYAPTEGLGGKVEYTIGKDAVVIHSYPQSLSTTYGIQEPITGTEFDLTQAYASYQMGPLEAQIGKMETLAGAEVIESPSDMNFSRSILFGYAVPFTVTGGRLTYAINGDLSFVAGGNQGWDTYKWVPANGDVGGITFEYGLIWNPSKAVSMTLDGLSGPPVQQGLAQIEGGFSKSEKTLTDLVATWHYNSALTLELNVDAGSQTNVPIYGTTTQYTGPYGPFLINGYGSPVVGTARWDGAALYLSYNTGLWTFSGRGEYFADNGGFRTGAQRDWTEGTGTVQYAPNSNLIFRAEYRFDATTNAFFATNQFNQTAYSNGAPILPGQFTNTNSGFGIEAIVKYP